MKINGFEVEAGCIIDSHWGQYGPDRLADIAEGFGCPLVVTGDPREFRLAANAAENAELFNIAGDWWECATWALDAIEIWLNDHAEGCYVEWFDGDCFICDVNEERDDW